MPVREWEEVQEVPQEGGTLMPTYRCYCCVNEEGRQGKDFEATPSATKSVSCPDCGEIYQPNIKLPRSARGSNDERARGHVIVVAVIHFDQPKNVKRGVGFPACSPKGVIGSPQFQHATGIANAVTCKACLATAAWKKTAADEEIYIPPDRDFDVVIDPAKPVQVGLPETPPTPTAKG